MVDRGDDLHAENNQIDSRGLVISLISKFPLTEKLTSVTPDQISSSCILTLVKAPAYAIFNTTAVATSTMLSSHTRLKRIASEVQTPDGVWLVCANLPT